MVGIAPGDREPHIHMYSVEVSIRLDATSRYESSKQMHDGISTFRLSCSVVVLSDVVWSSCIQRTVIPIVAPTDQAASQGGFWHVISGHRLRERPGSRHSRLREMVGRARPGYKTQVQPPGEYPIGRTKPLRGKKTNA